MGDKTKINFKKGIANFFGALGYFFCSILWVWTVLLYFSLLKAFALFITPNTDKGVVKPPVVVESGFSSPPMIISVVILAIVVALTVYVLVKMPSTIAKASKKVVHEAAENVAPMVLRVQHKKDTKRNHIRLTSRLILVMKVALIAVPVILSFVSQFVENQFLDFYIAMYVSLLLAGVSAIFFVTQYLLASVLSVKRQNLW